MRWLIVLAITGCTALPEVARDDGPLVLEDQGLLPIEMPRMRDPDPAPSVGAYAVHELPVRTGLAHGVHGALVDDVALTEDGRVAVTHDASGGLRLWPSVDGKHEPVAIVPAPGNGVQIVRDGDELVLAGLDLAGAIGLVRTSALGEQRARLQIVAPRPIVALRATARGIFAVRDDQRVELFDLRGARRGILVPEPGERITAIIARSGRTLALVTSSDGVRGRWIDGDGAWGTATPALAIEPGGAVLSPDGVHLAAVRAAGQTLVYVNLATGRAIDVPQPSADFGADFIEPVHPLGFIDRRTLAFATVFGGLVWWRGGAESTRGYVTPTHSHSAFEERPLIAATGDGHAVVGAMSFVVVERPGESHAYGYQDTSMTRGYPHGDGWWIANDEHNGFLELDAHFDVRRRLDPPAGIAPVYNMVPLDQRHVAVLGGDHTNYNRRQLYRVDLEGRDDVETLGSVDGYEIQYRPATRLLAVSGNGEHVFAHVDTEAGTIGPLIRLPTSDGQRHRLVLVDPATTGGLVGVDVADRGDETSELQEIRRVCESCEEQLPLARTYVLATSDVAATLQRYQMYDGASSVSPDRALVATTDGVRMRLVGTSGVERWALPARGIAQLLWTRRGELIALGNGIGHVDPATGALIDAQCGWSFGELAQPPSAFVRPSLCDLD
jgi:hypothetical protein